MKKIYLTLLSGFLGLGLGAQTLGNLDLANWNGNEPEEWLYFEAQTSDWEYGTNNYLTGFGEGESTFQETANPAPGNGNSARMETIAAVPGGQYEGATGESIITGILQQEAWNYNDRPAEFHFDVFAQPETGDECLVQAFFYDADGDVVGFSQNFYDTPHTGWESIVAPVSWLSQDQVESMVIQAVSSTGSPVVGSQIMVDNFDFVLLNPAPNVTNVVATDVDDNCNGTDLQVTFDVPADESNIANYYLLVTTPGITPGMIPDPLTFFQTAGFEMTPDGSNKTHVFTATDVYFFDDNGNIGFDEIQEGIPLVVHVYVEGQNGFDDVSNVSNSIEIDCSTASLFENEIEGANVYPNPATNKVNFDFGNNTVESLTITDMNGRTIETVKGNTSFVTVDVNSLENGVYFYNAVDNAGNIISANKFVVNH